MINKHKSKTDLILFMGQSNMAGRGDGSVSAAEKNVYQKCGAEFRAVSDPTRLYPLEEPLGINENRPGGIDDGAKKSGSMIPSFIQQYSRKNGRNVIAVSASQGGTSSEKWRECLAEDAADRLKRAIEYCKAQKIELGYVQVLFCQGETDGDHAVSAEKYKENFDAIWSELKRAGAQTCFLIQIGHFNYVKHPEGVDGKDGATLDKQYQVIREAQLEICSNYPDVVFAASFEGFLDEMKDHFHYNQKAYDIVGLTAADAVFEYRNRDF